MLLAEIGADGSQKDALIAPLGHFINRHDDIQGFVWFNTTPASTGATGDYRFDDTPAHLAAFDAMLTAVDARSF